MGLLVGGREPDDPTGSGRRLTPRVLLALLAASLAAGTAVALPALLRSGSDEPPAALGAADGWRAVTLCRTEPEDGCVERGPEVAERLAGLLLPLREVPQDQVTCLAVGERYTVQLEGGRERPPLLTVDTACGPVLAEGGRYEVDEEARAAVAAAWTGG